MFDEFYRRPWRLPFTRTAFALGEAFWGTTPAVDIIENESRYIITLEMPGVSAGDVEVRLSEERPSVKG